MSTHDHELSKGSKAPSLRAARSSMVLSLLCRIPVGAVSLLFIMAVRESGRSFGLAGLTSGACAVGAAISGPVLGRLADRLGQTPVLYGSAGATAATMLAFAALPRSAPVVVLPAVALLCGLALPPTPSSVRIVWRSMLPRAAFERIVTLDATLQELAFLLGPLLLITLAARTSAHAALAVTGLFLAAITALFGSLAATRLVKGAPAVAGGSWLGPVRYSGVRTHLLVATALGTCTGATEIGIITLVQDRGAQAWLSLLYGIWSLSSAAGGLLAMRYGSPAAAHRLLWLLMAGSLTSAALVLASGPVSLGILLPLAGACFAPLIGLQSSALAAITPARMLTEAYGLYAGALTVGVALGSSLSGVLVTYGSYRAAFAAAATSMAAAAVALAIRGRSGRGRSGQPRSGHPSPTQPAVLTAAPGSG